MADEAAVPLNNHSIPTRSRSKLVRASVILFGSWLFVFLAAVVLGAVSLANTPTDEPGGFALIIFPFAASVIWLPIAIASIVAAAIARARRTMRSRLAIVILVLNVVLVAFIWVFSMYWIYGVSQLTLWLAHR